MHYSLILKHQNPSSCVKSKFYHNCRVISSFKLAVKLQNSLNQRKLLSLQSTDFYFVSQESLDTSQNNFYKTNFILFSTKGSYNIINQYIRITHLEFYISTIPMFLIVSYTNISSWSTFSFLTLTLLCLAFKCRRWDCWKWGLSWECLAPNHHTCLTCLKFR